MQIPFSPGDIKPDKYWAVRNAIDRFFPKSLYPVPDPIPKLSGKTVHLTQRRSLIDLVTHENFIVYSQYPLKMEEMGEITYNTIRRSTTGFWDSRICKIAANEYFWALFNDDNRYTITIPN